MADYEKVLEAAKKYASKVGYQLNSDEQQLKAVIEALLKNEKRYGARYCPCRAVTGNKQEDAKIICPCVYHINEIKEQGHCRCRLFFAKTEE